MPRDDNRLQVRLNDSLWEWLEYRASRFGQSAEVQARWELQTVCDADHAWHARRAVRVRPSKEET